MNESTLMMSQELQGLVPDLEDETIFDHGRLAVVLCKIIGQDELLKGNLSSVSSESDPNVELIIDIKTALKIFKNMADITFENIKIIYLETSVSLGGPFMINSVNIKDVNQEMQVCKLCLKLVARSDKQVIF